MIKDNSIIGRKEIRSAVLIYDGECSLCRSAKDWIEKGAVPGQVEFLPCQSEERKMRFPQVTEEKCLKAMQVILPDGQIFSGDEAFREILCYMRRWKWLARLLQLPGIHFLSPNIYAWISKTRHKLSRAKALPYR